ncbi:MAG: NAD(P)-dependent alcohol dehydrogenase [Myxococcota bacterium]
MRAMVVDSYGTVDRLRVADVPAPQPRHGQVLVRVAASAVNHADAKVIGGNRMLHRRAFPLVVGYDFSGEVEAVGPGVPDLELHDHVFGHLPYDPRNRQGAFAEYVAVPRDQVARKPVDVSHEVAAAAATPGLTALQGLRDVGRLEQDQRVLVIGASGGVGSLAVGVAKRLGAHVTAVCRAEEAGLARELGADEVLDRSAGLPSEGAYHVIFDTPAAHAYRRCAHLLAPGGAYVTTLPSPAFFADKLRTLASSKRCGLVVVRPVRADLDRLASWIQQGLQVPIDSTHPVCHVARALERLGQGGVRGRIVIDVRDWTGDADCHIKAG